MRAFLDLITSKWDQFLACWHALPPEAKSTIIASGVGGVATILAATIGALVVLGQIGRQARNAIKQNKHNEALKLRLEVYKDIVGISRKASDAISDLSAFIRKFQSTLSLARQTQAELKGYAVPSAHPSQLIDKKSQLHSSNTRVMAITETWQIIDQRMDIFRTAINAALYDIDAAFHPYFDAAYHAMPIDAPVGKWEPPSAEALQQLEALGKTLIDTLMTLQSYIFDFLSEMQTILVGEMFGHTIPPRVPADSTSIVIQLSRYNELSTYFKKQTNWGRNQEQIENELGAGRTGS
jgi:hypothetical protein